MRYCITILLSAALFSGCAAGYANNRALERDNRSPRQCWDRCNDAGMRMVGYVFMWSAATACVCAMPEQQVSNRDVALRSASAAVVAQQRADEEAQQQQQQQQQQAGQGR